MSESELWDTCFVQETHTFSDLSQICLPSLMWSYSGSPWITCFWSHNFFINSCLMENGVLISLLGADLRANEWMTRRLKGEVPGLNFGTVKNSLAGFRQASSHSAHITNLGNKSNLSLRVVIDFFWKIIYHLSQPAWEKLYNIKHKPGH